MIVFTIPTSHLLFSTTILQHSFWGLFASLFYTNLSAKIDLSGLHPLKIGMYQSDPLSVMITVINTLVDTIKTRLDLGYCLQLSVNQLQYDMCLVTNSLSSCQQMLHGRGGSAGQV